ncbi:MAG: two-component regulator propeller domain-containing protein [Draconibacterium sp.]
MVALTLDGNFISTDTIPFDILPGDTVQYTFKQPVDFYHTDFRKEFILGAYILSEDENPGDNQFTMAMDVDGDYTGANEWMSYNSCDGMFSDISFSISEDKNGNIWSTDFYGASRFDGTIWTTYTDEDGLGEAYNWDLLKDHNGNLWFSGTQDSTITKYDGETFTVYNVTGNFGECIYEDAQGNVWFGSYEGDGVARFDGQSWTYFSTAEIGCGTTVVSITEDKEGNILLISYDNTGTVFAFDGSSWTQLLLPAPANNVVFSELFLDSKGKVWLAGSGLIGVFDGVEWFFFNQEDGIPYYCDDISEDSYGNIWFGGI